MSGRAGASCPLPVHHLEQEKTHQAPRFAACHPWQPNFGGVVIAAKWKLNGEVEEALFVSRGGLTFKQITRCNNANLLFI